jgi:DNA-binding MarR family transcriptional regulator
VSSEKGSETDWVQAEAAEAQSRAAAVDEAMRGLSVETGFFLDALAARLGMGQTDFTCLTVLIREGPATPGWIVDRTGLTSGAVTGVIDRLERGGWVQREADPADRRRVVVVALTTRLSELDEILQPMQAAGREIETRYGPEQLRAVASFARDSATMLAAQTDRLRQETASAAAGPPQPLSSPVAGVETGRLRLLRSLGSLVVRGDDLGEALFDARFPDPGPEVRVSGGELDVLFRRRRLRDLVAGGPGGELVLSQRVPWRIEAAGGANDLRLDLSALTIRAVSLRGGANQVVVKLPAPVGVVPVQVTGGASHVRLERPVGAVVTVQVRGAASQVNIDDQSYNGIGRSVGLSSRGASDAPDRFEIEVSGGANQVDVTERP